MTLPKTGSRPIRVDSNSYRWRLRRRANGLLHLALQSETGAGQVLLVYFEPHALYRQSDGHAWKFSRQQRAVSSGTVASLVRHALKNGWTPQALGKAPLKIYHWVADEILPELGTPAPAQDEVPARDIAIRQVSDLRFDLSLDSDWRRRLFAAKVQQKFELPLEFYGILPEARLHGLRFQVFNDGQTEGGYVVFGIQSVEFPGVVMYTTNNPEVL